MNGGAAIQDDCWLSNKKRRRLDDDFEFDEPRSCNNKRRKQHVESKKQQLDSVFAEDDDPWDPSFTTDARCKLPLYLSQFALAQFNMNKNALASFKMNKDEFYEGVYVVKTLTLVSAGDNRTTYVITFRAFLPADKTTQTFVTKVVVTLADTSHPTTKIRFVSINIKGVDDEENNLSVHYSEPVSESDDDGQSNENLPESDDEEDSEEDLSESNQKDSEEDLSESNQKDSEEDLSESNQKDSEEDLSESHHKDSEKILSEFDEQNSKTVTHCSLSLSRCFSQVKSNTKELIKEIESFNDDVAKSDGFEVGYYPLMEAAGIHGTWVFKFYDIANTTLCTTDMNKLVHLSQLALCVYNMKEDTYFDKIKVLKAMTSGCAGTKYNITFEASSRDKKAEIFRTRLVESYPRPYRNVMVMFVRTKDN